MQKYGVVFVVLAGIVAILFFSFRNDSAEEDVADRQSQFSQVQTITEPAKVVLAPEKQKIIWDAEHVTFEIERRLGPLLLRAIEQHDVDALVKRCTPQFTGTIPVNAKQVERHKPPLSVWSLPPVFEVQEADARQTMSHIVERNQKLKQVQRRRLRVLEIEHDAEDPALWKCRFLLTFSGPDVDSGERLVESESRVNVRFDEEDDLVNKPVLTSWVIDHQTERSCSQPLMQEITDEAGLSGLGIPDNWKLPHSKVVQYQFQLAVEDFDRDGDADVTLTTVNGRRYVLANESGKFVNRTVSLELPPIDRQPGSLKFMAVWFDYDNDGFPDLLSGSRLFHNEGGVRFTDVTGQSGLSFDRETMGGTVADYNGDGLLDLYVLYQKPFARSAQQQPERAQWVDETDTGKKNQLWKNLGGGRFANVTDSAGAGGYKRHTHAAAWLHYDDDHWPDLYIANDFGRNVLLRNMGNGKFEDVTDSSGASGFATSMGVCSGDIDNNGMTDIYVANMYSKMGRRIIGMVSDSDYPKGIYPQIQGSCAGNRLYCRDASSGAGFTEISDQAGVNAVGWAWGPAMFDADNDGLLDLYATSGFLSFERNKPDG